MSILADLYVWKHIFEVNDDDDADVGDNDADEDDNEDDDDDDDEDESDGGDIHGLWDCVLPLGALRAVRKPIVHMIVLMFMMMG